MTPKHRSFSVRARFAFAVAASVAGSLLIAGCGVGGSLSSTGGGANMAAAFTGKLTGGPNPIVGATVKVYATGDSYGTGTFLQEATQVGASAGQDTAADGSFTFAGGYTCPNNHFLYIVSTGGNTGAGENPKATLVAGLGRCEDLFTGGVYTGQYIYLNELSTVAAAYALGNFSSVSGTGHATVVGIGAPPANNASVGCVANGSTCTTTAAAGLRHAFENEANLVSPFLTYGNAMVPGNTVARVPLQLINSIANSLVACVNSNGTSAPCTTVMGATGTNASTGNTFQAMVNLAKNPTLAGTAFTTTDFLHAATPQTSFYQPILVSAPHDYSIAIIYPRGMGITPGTQGLSYPYSGTLDINDNLYVGNYNNAAEQVYNALSLTSNGTLVSFTPDNLTNLTASGASADALGHVFMVGYSPSITAATVTKFTVDNTTGAISPGPLVFLEGTDHPLAGAVDRKNNFWYGTQLNPTIVEVPAGSVNTSITVPVNAPVTTVAIDPDQNIWATLSTTNTVGVVQNQGTTATPSYSVPGYVTTTLPNSLPSGISFVDAGSGTYTGYVANSGTTPGLTPVTPTITGTATVSALTPGVQVATGVAPLNNQTDGAGSIWAADATELVKYIPGSGSTSIIPCHFQTVAGNTTCTTIDYDTIRSVSIDSTGSVWFLISGSAAIGQSIGGAAPTWPLQSLGLLGLPQ